MVLIRWLVILIVSSVLISEKALCQDEDYEDEDDVSCVFVSSGQDCDCKYTEDVNKNY